MCEPTRDRPLFHFGKVARRAGHRFLPGPEVAGYCGWFDFNNAINALKRKDGEYILFAEDDGAQKVNIFHWKL